MKEPFAQLQGALCRHRGLVSGCLATITVFTIVATFPPFWNTNDDVGMAMRAHGFGSFVEGTPFLQWGNIVWGYLVSSIPPVAGVLGYSIATLSALFLIIWFLLYLAIESSGMRWGVLLSMVIATVLIATRPLIFPQFTINAGLLTVAAAMGLIAYGYRDSLWLLIPSCILAYLGFLVRDNQFFLITAVALPLLPWRTLYRRKEVRLALVALVVLMATSKLVHHQAYSAPEWESFTALQQSRVYWMDFGGFTQVLEHPEIHEGHGLSENDIQLLQAWFFADASLANPGRLNAMRTDVDILPDASAFSKAREGSQAIFNRDVAPILFAGLLLFFFFPSTRLAIAWSLTLGALFYLGYLGRPGVMRVYIPLFSLLVLSPLLLAALKQTYGNRTFNIIAVLLSITFFWNAREVVTVHAELTEKAKDVQADLKAMEDLEILNKENNYLVTWGASFPYELAYPVLKRSHDMGLQLYALGSSTLNPYSVAQAQEEMGTGLVTALLSDEGVLFNTGSKGMSLLEGYCQQHHGGRFQSTREVGTPAISIYHAKCESVVSSEETGTQDDH